MISSGAVADGKRTTECNHEHVHLSKDRLTHAEKRRSLVRAGSYSGCVFYRAERGFVVQGGLQDAQGNKRTASTSNPPLVSAAIAAIDQE